MKTKTLTCILVALLTLSCTTHQELPYRDVTKAALKAFYLQRMSMPIEEQYAGQYARPAAHMDTVVYVHPSAATQLTPAGTILSCPCGWYDAGDYNKYIVNSGFAIGILLQSYERMPQYYAALDVNIPESTSEVPDILEEVMYNLRWMQTMQDPEDGGVYHKLTTPNFEAFIRPTECQQPRYVVQKTTAAALDFAATMALAARVYAPFPKYAEFCQTAREQAEKAFLWAVNNDEVYYDQDGMNKLYEPAINTGAYGDGDVRDEFFWAATELFVLTQQPFYKEVAEKYEPQIFVLPTWGYVASLGLYECIDDYQDLLLNYVKSCPEKYGTEPTDFFWGCNGEACANRGIAFLEAYRITNDEEYLKRAKQTAEWLMGDNPTGYCFITGFGEKRVMHPHHRLSASDDIEDPLPGFLAGGPNPGKQDNLNYPSDEPVLCYLDDVNSYASNEIAINWNAYLVALMAGLDNVQSTPAKSLVGKLQSLNDRGIMYGHQDDPFYGLSWAWEQGKSDTKALLGDMPAVLGFDLGGLEEGHASNLDSVPFEWIRTEAINHVKKGGIITFSWHARNPRTGGTAWDTSDRTTVRNILPGGEQYDLFVGWMDSVASFLETLKDENGNPIPFIFRPWHEYNGSWFWWGQNNCSSQEFLALWTMFQDYMNKRMPANIVWSQSPNLQGNWTEKDFLCRFAGARRVDVLGEDCYQWGSEEDFISQCAADIAFLSAFAKQNGILFAVTECGKQNSTTADWWGRVFLPVVEAGHPCYFLPWRNWSKEHFGFAPEANTADDVRQLYKDKKFLLLGDIQ